MAEKYVANRNNDTNKNSNASIDNQKNNHANQNVIGSNIPRISNSENKGINRHGKNLNPKGIVPPKISKFIGNPLFKAGVGIMKNINARRKVNVVENNEIDEQVDEQADEQTKEEVKAQQIEEQKKELVQMAKKEAVNKAKDKAKQVIKEKIKTRIIMVAASHPIVLLIIVLIICVTILVGSIAIYSSINSGGKSGNTIWTLQLGGQKYDFSEITVDVIKCDDKTGPNDIASQTVVQSDVSLKKYVIGTFLGEAGQDYPDEAIKAHLIMIRNYALTRQTAMCPSVPDNCGVGLNYQDGKVRMRACENDQVYWDYEQDIYRYDRGSVSLYSPEIDHNYKGATVWKSVGNDINEERLSEIEALYDEIENEYLVDENGNLFYTNFVNTQTQQTKSLAEAGSNYKDILFEIYPGSEIQLLSYYSSGGSDGEFYDDVVYYNQNDYSEYFHPGCGSIAGNGCGTTSMAIIVSTLLQENIDPVTVTRYANEAGLTTCSSGSSWSMGCNVANHYGLQCEKINGTSPDTISHVSSELATGQKMVMILVGPGIFTNGGHYMVLAGVNDKNQYLLFDPASRERSNQYFDISTIVSNMASHRASGGGIWYIVWK